MDQPLAPSSAIRLLGEFTHGLRLADVPGEVRRQGALSLLDTLGCMVAGSATADARALLAAESGDGAGADGAAGVAVLSCAGRGVAASEIAKRPRASRPVFRVSEGMILQSSATKGR